MDESSAPNQDREATPIFGAYRRGYDPEQVDRYVTEQQRRLEDALHRASEAERKLGAAIGQLRELHRRVTVLESEERAPQPPSLDTLGERVQRILNEAWEGAYALRQQVEQEVSEQRQHAEVEAAEIVAAAEVRAVRVDEEAARRAQEQHERIEHERSRAVSQISYLHNQRKMAVGELLRLKEVIETTVLELEPPTPRTQRHSSFDALVAEEASTVVVAHDEPTLTGHHAPAHAAVESEELSDEERVRRQMPVRFQRPKLAPADPPQTMPVHRLQVETEPLEEADPSSLVREHRAAEAELQLQGEFGEEDEDGVPPPARLYDFEAE